MDKASASSPRIDTRDNIDSREVEWAYFDATPNLFSEGMIATFSGTYIARGPYIAIENPLINEERLGGLDPTQMTKGIIKFRSTVTEGGQEEVCHEMAFVKKIGHKYFAATAKLEPESEPLDTAKNVLRTMQNVLVEWKYIFIMLLPFFLFQLRLLFLMITEL